MPNPSDPIWGIVGFVATVIFGVIGVSGVILTIMQVVQTRKALGYEFQSITSVLTVARDLQEQIEIRLNGQVVRNVYLVLVRFRNIGRASIRPEDFVRPLKLSVTNGQIISAEVTEADPEDIGEIIQAQDKDSLTCKKVLLNSKDQFILKLLVSDFSGDAHDIRVGGHIEGIKRVEPLKENRVLKFLLESPTGWAFSLIPGIGPIVAAIGTNTLAEIIALVERRRDDS